LCNDFLSRALPFPRLKGYTTIRARYAPIGWKSLLRHKQSVAAGPCAWNGPHDLVSDPWDHV